MDGATYLLLLPPPPSPPTVPALKALYGDTLLEVLKEAQSTSKDSTAPSVLDIALACPHLALQATKPNAEAYDATQSIISNLYTLVCLLSAQNHTNLEDSDGVDVRILPIAWSPDPEAHSSFTCSTMGPVIDLQTLAASQRPWQYAFGVENDEGEVFVRAFVAAKQAAANNHSASLVPSQPALASSTPQSKTHHHVAVGGTFDHLHIGHKLLLTMTAFVLDHHPTNAVMTVGITGDALLKNKKYASYIQSWSDRQEAVHAFIHAILVFAAPDTVEPVVNRVNEQGPNGHAVVYQYPGGLNIRYVEISDAYGPTITDQDISALVISAETRAGGKAVNDKRSENGWAALDVFEVGVLDSSGIADSKSQQEFQNKIGSTKIREKKALADQTASS